MTHERVTQYYKNNIAVTVNKRQLFTSLSIGTRR